MQDRCEILIRVDFPKLPSFGLQHMKLDQVWWFLACVNPKKNIGNGMPALSNPDHQTLHYIKVICICLFVVAGMTVSITNKVNQRINASLSWTAFRIDSIWVTITILYYTITFQSWKNLDTGLNDRKEISAAAEKLGAAVKANTTEISYQYCLLYHT